MYRVAQAAQLKDISLHSKYLKQGVLARWLAVCSSSDKSPLRRALQLSKCCPSAACLLVSETFLQLLYSLGVRLLRASDQLHEIGGQACKGIRFIFITYWYTGCSFTIAFSMCAASRRCWLHQQRHIHWHWPGQPRTDWHHWIWFIWSHWHWSNRHHWPYLLDPDFGRKYNL